MVPELIALLHPLLCWFHGMSGSPLHFQSFKAWASAVSFRAFPSCERKLRVVFLFLKPIGLCRFAAHLGGHHHRPVISVWRFSVADTFTEWLGLNSVRRNNQPRLTLTENPCFNFDAWLADMAANRDR